MKIKNYFIIGIFLISISGKAQEVLNKNNTETFETIKISENSKKNLLLLDFLKSDSRFNNNKLKKLIKLQLSSNNNSYKNSNTRGSRNFGNGTTSITKIFLNNEQILGEGINRLYALNQLRMKDIDKINLSNVSYDPEIYIYKK